MANLAGAFDAGVRATDTNKLCRKLVQQYGMDGSVCQQRAQNWLADTPGKGQKYAQAFLHGKVSGA